MAIDFLPSIGLSMCRFHQVASPESCRMRSPARLGINGSQQRWFNAAVDTWTWSCVCLVELARPISSERIRVPKLGATFVPDWRSLHQALVQKNFAPGSHLIGLIVNWSGSPFSGVGSRALGITLARAYLTPQTTADMELLKDLEWDALALAVRAGPAEQGR